MPRRYETAARASSPRGGFRRCAKHENDPVPVAKSLTVHPAGRSWSVSTRNRMSGNGTVVEVVVGAGEVDDEVFVVDPLHAVNATAVTTATHIVLASIRISDSLDRAGRD
jgi:hypothetical protein